MTKRLVTLLLVALLTLTIAIPASAATYLTIATGGTQGTYYALGGDFANLLTQEMTDVESTAQATGGSADNIRLVSQGECELATVQNDVATYAYQGAALFEGEQIQNFGVIGNLYPEVVQLVYSDDSAITDLASLKGKRVSIGASGSGVYANAMDFLAQAGLTEQDIDAQYLSFDESADAIKNRQIDAAFVVAGVPNPAVTDLASTMDVELLNLADADADALCAAHPYYNKFNIPAGTYASQTSDAQSLNISAILIAGTDTVSEEMGYEITKLLYESTEKLSHAKKSEVLITNALNGFDPAMLHPGAAKYYREKGLLN